jgi:hypothetical protein
VLSRTAARDARSRARAGARQARAQANASAKQARASAKLAKAGARQAAAKARVATAQTTTQLTPLAKNAQQSVGRGIYGARVWAAPRLERGGIAVQERLAPRVSAAMTATAHRLQPAPIRGRRRWPFIVGGMALLAAGGAAAAVLRSQRKSMANVPPAPPPTPMPAPGQPAASSDLGENAQVDVNGQVRTP